jgi:hypothetical protein
MIANTINDVINRCVEDGSRNEFEQELIEEYLRERGYSLSYLQGMPELDAREIIADACLYASSQMELISLN